MRNQIDDLADFLECIGVDVFAHSRQTVILDDAVINIEYDSKEELVTFSVNLTDKVTTFKHNSLYNIFTDYDDDYDYDYDEEDIEILNKTKLDFKFKMNSKVTVDGYMGKVFNVDGANMDYDGVLYLLTDIETGDYYEAYEEDMSLYEDNTLDEDKTVINIDALLDEYNDYMSLYKSFGDEEYKTHALNVLGVIKSMCG